MSKKLNRIYLIANLLAIIIAVLIGLFAQDFSKSIKFFGDWYITCLKVIISPLIFCVMSLFVLKRDENPKFLIGKTIILFLIMFIVTFAISSIIVYFMNPGSWFKVSTGDSPSTTASFDIVSILKNIIPKSFEDVFYGKNIFFIILVALLSALIISFIKKIRCGYTKGILFCKKYIDIVLKVIIALTPLAVISLVSNMIIAYNVKVIEMGAVYILIAYGLSLITLVVVMMLPVWIIAKINPISYCKKACKVWLVSISTCSSAATLPHTMRVCNEEFGVDEKITNVVVPLGCTIHMCGGAVSFALLGLFVAQMSNIQLTFGTYLLMMLVATLINMAAPGIPGGGKVIGFTYLSTFGLPVNTFYEVYIAIYGFLDMAYTTLNVTGDVSANVILDNFEKRMKKKTNTEIEAPNNEKNSQS